MSPVKGAATAAVDQLAQTEIGDGSPKRKGEELALVILPPDFRILELRLEGVTPLVVNRFSAKAMEQMKASQEAGSVAKSRKQRDPKDFERLFNEAKHVSEEGWEGVAASGFRNGAVSACRAAGYVMTKLKLAFFVEPDGFDVADGSPLVRIEGEAVPWLAMTRNQTGVVDLRNRPMYKQWACNLRVRYDAGMLKAQDVANLVARIGMQVGIGEGRPDSKNSAGLGYGLFQIV